MLQKTLSLFILCWCFIHRVDAQLVNNGQVIAISGNAWVTIDGDYKHMEGKVANDGKLVVKGDWINNDATSFVFTNASIGEVEFAGSNQGIGGRYKTVFPSLTLTGDGIKSLDVDIGVLNYLNIGNQELDIRHYDLSILSADVNAIKRTNGFISTTQRGKLIRNISTAGWYLFPFSAKISNSSGRFFYRPLEIEAKNGSINMFSVSLVPEDPTNVGYDRNSKRKDIQNISDKYFYLLNHESGSSSITARVYRNTTADGNSSQLVSWNTMGIWEKVGPSTKEDGIFGDNLNRYLVFSSTERITNLPLSFADYLNDKDSYSPFTFFNAFSPDGDGKNDTWVIQNLEYYPKNSLIIFNRWGDEVYKVIGYDKSKAWDGGSQSPGTYYYILNAEVNGQMKTYKGFITMMKKE